MLVLACSSENGVPGHTSSDGAAGSGAGGQGGGAAGGGAELPPKPVLGSCGFSYDQDFVYDAPSVHPGPLDRRERRAHRVADQASAAAGPAAVGGTGWIAHADPTPPFTRLLSELGARGEPSDDRAPDIVLPGYSDDMPLFERGAAWTSPTRCYETPFGVELLTEPQAYDLYRSIAEQTTGVPFDATPEQRTVVGLRGAYPGRLLWNDNRPNRFNDTLVLLWADGSGTKHVREFPVNTDTGAYDFGVDSSSSLRPNRRYHYRDGWHNTYNALHVDEIDYRVRDDSNHNGHWDSDRNGWLPPLDTQDHDRTGGGHNIHMGSVDAPLGTAAVYNWSAGCQVIPGMANWIEFISNAWTNEGDALDYFLIDVRDVPREIWRPCTPDGSRRCPYLIDALPFTDSRDTSSAGPSAFDGYNCSAADESGPEIVYLLPLDASGTLTATVDAAAPVDVDVHLLDGSDPQACLARDDASVSYDITPGRYWIVVDSFVSNGQPAAGPYTLTVSLP